MCCQLRPPRGIERPRRPPINIGARPRLGKAESWTADCGKTLLGGTTRRALGSASGSAILVRRAPAGSRRSAQRRRRHRTPHPAPPTGPPPAPPHALGVGGAVRSPVPLVRKPVRRAPCWRVIRKPKPVQPRVGQFMDDGDGQLAGHRVSGHHVLLRERQEAYLFVAASPWAGRAEDHDAVYCSRQMAAGPRAVPPDKVKRIG